MKYATIMVHLALEHPNEARLRIAGDLAEQFSAGVIGIAACDHTPPPYYMDGALAQQLLAQDRANLQARLAELEAECRAKLAGRAQALEWRASLARPTDYVAHQARAADLIVVGSHGEGTLLDPFRHLDVSALLMQAGRPLLIVPPAVDWLKLGAALVAWKDTREARRAVADAIPLLQRMREVQVVEVLENGAAVRAQARVDDVVRWLKSHGVTAAGRTIDPEEDAATALAIAASSMGADVVVAGGYGHTRFSEWVFGGVTRGLLGGETRCCLLSH